MFASCLAPIPNSIKLIIIQIILKLKIILTLLILKPSLSDPYVCILDLLCCLAWNTARLLDNYPPHSVLLQHQQQQQQHQPFEKQRDEQHQHQHEILAPSLQTGRTIPPGIAVGPPFLLSIRKFEEKNFRISFDQEKM